MTKTAISTGLIDRKTASRLLKMSIRTIDRYRQSGRLSTMIVDNKIYLKKEEIRDLVQRHDRQGERVYVSMVDSEDIKDTREDIGDSGDDKQKNHREQMPQHGRHERALELENYYKNIIEDLTNRLQEYQKRLEENQKRVYQLESQLRSSVPLLEYRNETQKLLEEGQTLKKAVQEQQEVIKKAKKALSVENFNKRIYLVLVIGLILLQPLWILLSR
jgi:DNA repair exonuclease SbcCD ATPase subunit